MTNLNEEGLTAKELDEIQELEKFPLDPRDLGDSIANWNYKHNLEHSGIDYANLELVRKESDKGRATRKYLQRARLHRQQVRRARIFAVGPTIFVVSAAAAAVSYYALFYA